MLIESYNFEEEINRKKRLNSYYKIMISGLHYKNFIQLKWLVQRKIVLSM